MKLIVISPETEDPREHGVLAELFAAGLTSYHLRKPEWLREQMAAWLRALPAEHHSQVVLHSHHDLASQYAVGGVHNVSDDAPLAPLRSCAVHTLEDLRDRLDTCGRLLFSPVFPSISKPGYGPNFSSDELRDVLARPRSAEVIALGGIEASRIATCLELGFDGVAVLGALWQSSNPVMAFRTLSRACARAVAA